MSLRKLQQFLISDNLNLPLIEYGYGCTAESQTQAVNEGPVREDDLPLHGDVQVVLHHVPPAGRDACELRPGHGGDHVGGVVQCCVQKGDHAYPQAVGGHDQALHLLCTVRSGWRS